MKKIYVSKKSLYLKDTKYNNLIYYTHQKKQTDQNFKKNKYEEQ